MHRDKRYGNFCSASTQHYGAAGYLPALAQRQRRAVSRANTRLQVRHCCRAQVRSSSLLTTSGCRANGISRTWLSEPPERLRRSPYCRSRRDESPSRRQVGQSQAPALERAGMPCACHGVWVMLRADEALASLGVPKMSSAGFKHAHAAP